jgi:hypothetical protein
VEELNIPPLSLYSCYNVRHVGDIMVKTNLNVGSLVKMKPYAELQKLGIKGPEEDIPFLNDVGVVIQILETHVVVLWQKLHKEGGHFPYTLDKIAD